jgi:hypothetical protein
MLKNKKGLIGKIFVALGIIILIILLIAGITAWQGYNFYKTATVEVNNMKIYSEKLTKGDCTQIKNIELSASKIKLKAQEACINPIINIAIDKMEQIPIKCNNLKELENQMLTQLAPIKELCNNQTLMDQLAKLNYTRQ